MATIEDVPLKFFVLYVDATATRHSPPFSLSSPLLAHSDAGTYVLKSKSCEACESGRYAPTAQVDQCLECGGLGLPVSPHLGIHETSPTSHESYEPIKLETKSH